MNPFEMICRSRLQVKDRVAMLERLATDRPMSLEREFEKLRERH